MTNKPAVVLLSGGLDSTVALAHTLKHHSNAIALTFDYGQTHSVELYAAMAVATFYNVEHHIIDLRPALATPCALTGHGDIPEHHAETVDATFVPGRNLTMIAVGVAVAAGRDATNVVIGANADDHNGYPDCRPEFISSVDETARRSTADRVGVWAPLLRMTKADIVSYGHILHAPLERTYSCYRGDPQPCDNCGACESRNQALAAHQ